MLFRARHFEFRFPRPAIIMGIVNVTPDSFSDGGQFLAADAAVDHGLELVAQGAEILDIGGESTRPGAAPVPAAEELRRVLPVIEKLAALTPVALAIDTVKPAVARAALAAGASLVNDVAARHSDAAMWQVLADFQAGYICMHAQGTPPTMQQNPAYTDVVREVDAFFAERLATLLHAAGIAAEHVALDPGIGFGKTSSIICSSSPVCRASPICTAPSSSASPANPSSKNYPAPASLNACQPRSPAQLWQSRMVCKSSAPMMWRKPSGRSGWPRRSCNGGPWPPQTNGPGN